MTMLSLLAILMLSVTPSAGTDGPAPVQAELAASTLHHDVPFPRQHTSLSLAAAQLTLPAQKPAAAPDRTPVLRRNLHEVVPAFWYESAPRPLPEASLPPPRSAWFFESLLKTTQRR